MKERWSFLRKNSNFEKYVKDIVTIAEKIVGFPELEDIFGKYWLDTQKNNSFFPFGHQRLSSLEVAVKELGNVSGFEAWKSNILSNPREFDSYEFEILEISRIANFADSLEIYPPVDKGDPDQTPLSELKVFNNNTEFYIEMTKFRSISNPKNKIKKLIEKGRGQIPRDSAGFIFADVSDVTLKEYNSYEDNKLIWKVISNIEIICNEVDQFFRGQNTRILGVVLIESYLTSNENYQVGLTNRYLIIENPFNKLGFNSTQIRDLIFPHHAQSNLRIN